MHETIPFNKKEWRTVQEQQELEHCSIIVHPNYNEEDKLVIVGMYRPPEKDHPDYAPILKQALQYHREQQLATTLMGDFNINAWEHAEKGSYQAWIAEENLWVLSNPMTPTFKAGTVTDAVLMVMGKYHPEGLLPPPVDQEQNGGDPGVYPVFISEEVAMIDHHALFLDILTIDLAKMPQPITYKIHSLTKENWEQRDAKIREAPMFQKLLEQKGSKDDNIERQYSLLMNILKEVFKDRLQRAGGNQDWNAEQVYEKKHAKHELMLQYNEAKLSGNESQRIQIINEIGRSDWKEFLSTTSTNDMRRIFHYFAKKDGRSQPFYRPACLDPLLVEGNIVVHPQQKAEALARFFAKKMSAEGKEMRSTDNEVRRNIRMRYAGGRWPLEPKVTRDEVLLAAKDMSLTKAPGPDKMPAEFYYHLPALLEVLPDMYTRMLELNKIPSEATKYYILPFDKFGRDPGLCKNKRPISLLNT